MEQHGRLRGEHDHAEDALECLRQVTEKLLCYAQGSGDRSASTCSLLSPEELEREYRHAHCPLSLVSGDESDDSQDTAPLEKVLAACELTMRHSVRTSHPHFMNQLYGAPDPVAVGGEWLSTLLNTNVHTYEVAPVFTMMEQHVLAKVATLVGDEWVHGSTSRRAVDGLLVPGGSIANMYGVLCARHHRFPEIRDRGIHAVLHDNNIESLVLCVSTAAHYSYKKSAIVMGLGTENVLMVEERADGSMCPEALDRVLREAKEAGRCAFFVGATCGSTVRGSFDDLGELAAVCARHGAWLHADAAWGGAALLSKTLREKYLNEIERCDSVAWNPHKLIGMPIQCSVFLSRHEDILKQSNATNASYLFQKDKAFAEHDLGDRTFICGRRADGCKLWLSWLYYGDVQLKERVEGTMRLAARLAQMIRERRESFSLVFDGAQFANVCFWFIPPSLRASFRSIDLEDSAGDGWQQLHRTAPALKRRMQEEGAALVGFQPYASLPNFFRVVLPGAANVNDADLVHILDTMERLGANL